MFRIVRFIALLIAFPIAAIALGEDQSPSSAGKGGGKTRPGPAAAEGEKQTPAEGAPLRDPSMLVRLVRSQALQDDLQLKREARQAIADLVAEVEYPLFQIRDYPAERKRDTLNQLSDKVENSLREKLTETEHARLKEIVLRAHGWPALLTPSRAEALRLTEAQISQIQQALSEPAPAEKEKATPVDARIQKLLTADQKSALAALVGKSFDFSKVPQLAAPAPELRDVTDWVNTQPLKLSDLRGRVVALHFFAFGCSNCVNNQPHYKDWHKRYAGKDVTVLGIHTPETARERDVENLRADAKTRGLEYPIAVDGKASNWTAWSNHMWPSVYLIDRRGYVRYWWYGELNWQGAEGEAWMRSRIDELLAEKE